MKTAILKTELWDDDIFYELNIDTKLLYLLLASSLERGVSDVYRVSDRILSARSGLNEQQLKVCKKQLAEKGLAEFHDSYVWLKGSAYVMPKRGRFTDEAMEREARSLPEVIREKFNSSLIVEYYYNTLYKNKDIDIDNNKDNNKNMDKDKGYKLYAKRRDELFAKAGF